MRPIDGFRGQRIGPEDAPYEEARRVWNARIDRRPACILRCTGATDVAAALAHARAHGLTIAIRGGGHDIAGNGVCDGGLVIDLSPMKRIRVDPERRTVHVQAGVTWGELDIETQAFGLVTPGGQCSSTGVVGVMLGGGLGWLMGKHGLTIDNLLSVELVTVDGALVRASADENRELFWALRGGGGNFGVVLSIELRLHSLARVVAGVRIYPADVLADALRFFRDSTARAPDDLTTCLFSVPMAPPPGAPEHLAERPLVALATCWSGPPSEADAVLRPLRAFGRPLVDTLAEVPYCAFQSAFDGAEADRREYAKHQRSAYLASLDDATIERLAVLARAAPSRRCSLLAFPIGGAVRRVDADATAFSGRDARILMVAQSVWDDAEEDGAPHIEWSRACGSMLRSVSDGRTYPNYVDADEPPERVPEVYGASRYARLAAVKRAYDPTNVLRMNRNVRP